MQQNSEKPRDWFKRLRQFGADHRLPHLDCYGLLVECNWDTDKAADRLAHAKGLPPAGPKFIPATRATPGPWHFDLQSQYVRAVGRRLPGAENCIAVARVTSSNFPYSEIVANGRLIASAPVLSSVIGEGLAVGNDLVRLLEEQNDWSGKDARPDSIFAFILHGKMKNWIASAQAALKDLEG